MKTRSIKTEKPLVKNETVIEINLSPTENGFPPDYTETTPEVERNKTK